MLKTDISYNDYSILVKYTQSLVGKKTTDGVTDEIVNEVSNLLEKMFDFDKAPWILEELYLSAPTNACIHVIEDGSEFIIGDAAREISMYRGIVSSLNPSRVSSLNLTPHEKLKFSRITNITTASYTHLLGSLSFYKLPFNSSNLTERQNEVMDDLASGRLMSSVNSDFNRLQSLIVALTDSGCLPDVKIRRYAFMMAAAKCIFLQTNGILKEYEASHSRGNNELTYSRILSRHLRNTIKPLRRETARLALDYFDHCQGVIPHQEIFHRIANRVGELHEKYINYDRVTVS